MEKLRIIIDNASVIIENSKKHKDLVFDIGNIKSFINTSVELILGKMKELDLL